MENPFSFPVASAIVGEMSGRVVTLLTDFGMRDGYVAAMKGVLATYAPGAILMDAGHGIPPQNVFAASWALCQYAWYFPEGTIHQVVVDPGVGTRRHALLVMADGRFFIGPDNGVLAMTVGRAEHRKLGVIKPEIHLPDHLSHTFHGRDVFSYAAALLASGTYGFDDLVNPLESMVSLPVPPVSQTSVSISGSIIHIDGFGNLITNIREHDVQHLTGTPREIAVTGSPVIQRWVSTYGDMPEGELAALINSSGHVEIACNGSSAARKTRATLGCVVEIRV